MHILMGLNRLIYGSKDASYLILFCLKLLSCTMKFDQPTSLHDLNGLGMILAQACELISQFIHNILQ